MNTRSHDGVSLNEWADAEAATRLRERPLLGARRRTEAGGVLPHLSGHRLKYCWFFALPNRHSSLWRSDLDLRARGGKLGGLHFHILGRGTTTHWRPDPNCEVT